ncbi:MAG: flagellar hook-associated protein FlgL [Steroidobacteraceae bacterium]
MRISTAQIHSNALSAMMRRQTELSKTQTEVSSGKRVNKPSDDPVAMTRILQLEQQKAANTQFASNSAAATTRLNLEEQALADTETAIQRVYELTVQANSSGLNASDRDSIVTELKSLKSQLVDLANRKDTNNEYLFSGYASGTQPFTLDSAGNVAYSGATATRSLQVSSSQYVSDGDAGNSVFMNIASGNGLFASSATSTNTGTGVINGSIADRSAWVADDYTLSFNGGNWTVTDSSNNTVATGAYTAGAAINFNGAQLTVTGTPADGDSFTIANSSNEDIFTTIDKLTAAISAPQDTDAQKAQYQNSLNAAMTQLEQAETHTLSVRTSVGVRLSSLQTIDTTREDTLANITVALSGLQDSDYAAAVSRLSQQYVGLQAAQQSYAKIAQLSLFNYIK